LIDQNEILENAKDKNSPAKLIRMSTAFEVEKANKYSGNLAKRAA